MSGDFTTTYVVEQAPEDVYAAILDVGSWWTGELDGPTDEVGAEFVYGHGPQHTSRQRVVGLEPGRRVGWLVTASALTFVSEPAEWTGSEISFDLRAVPEGTELTFTHVGLVPDVECYGACSTGWSHYVGASLRSRITTGVGLPDPW